MKYTVVLKGQARMEATVEIEAESYVVAERIALTKANAGEVECRVVALSFTADSPRSTHKRSAANE